MASPIHYLEAVALDSTGDMLPASLAGRVQTLWWHAYSQGYVYPTLADGAEIVSANADWTLGAFATVVPADTITNDYHVHNLTIEACDRNGVFEVVLYQGADDDEIARIRFATAGGFWGNAIYELTACESVPANARIRAKCASSNGAAEIVTLRVSICYGIEEV